MFDSKEFKKSAISFVIAVATAMSLSNSAYSKDYSDKDKIESVCLSDGVNNNLKSTKNTMKFDSFRIDRLNTADFLIRNFEIGKDKEIIPYPTDSFIEVEFTEDNVVEQRELTLIEQETIARYFFDLEDESLWKECVCTVLAEGGSRSFEEGYHITSTVLNRLRSYRWVRSQTFSLYHQFTSGQFTAYKNSFYYSFYNMSIENLRELEAYKGICKALSSLVESHNYTQFRSKGSPFGEQFVDGGNKYRDPLTEEDIIPFEERPVYQKIMDVISDPNNELYNLFMIIPEGEMPLLDYSFEQLEKMKNQEEKIDEKMSLILEKEEKFILS